MLVRRGDLIGAGGMAEVFRGELLDGATAIRQVAIKCMRSTADDRIGCLFEREARIVAALSHPNIVSLIDVIQDDNEPPVLIMELVEGIALSRLVGTPRPLPVVVYIGIQVLQALAHAHSCGVVHRDVSPHNVLLSHAGEVKLTDFGLSQFASFDHTTLTGCKGKVGYMSPEQAYGTDIDSRSDLFAVGIMLYELATGALPFGGGPLPRFLHQLLGAPFPAPSTLRPDMHPELEAIILGLLERDIDQRFASAGDVLDALAALPSAGAGELAQLVADSHDATAAQPAPRARREHITVAPLADEPRRTLTARPLSPRRRRRRRWVAAGLGAALVACVAVWMLRDQPQRSPQSSPAIVTEDPAPGPRSPSTLPAPLEPIGMQRMAEELPTVSPPTRTAREPARPQKLEPSPDKPAAVHSGIDYPAVQHQSSPFDIYVTPTAPR